MRKSGSERREDAEKRPQVRGMERRPGPSASQSRTLGVAWTEGVCSARRGWRERARPHSPSQPQSFCERWAGHRESTGGQEELLRLRGVF